VGLAGPGSSLFNCELNSGLGSCKLLLLSSPCGSLLLSLSSFTLHLLSYDKMEETSLYLNFFCLNIKEKS